MIIHNPRTGPSGADRNRSTVLTAALSPTSNTTATAQDQATPALGDPEQNARKRRDARDRVELDAAIATLAADGNGLLDGMEGDDDQDPFDLADRFGRSFDERAGATFAPIADPARKASAFRKLQPVRARLMAAARIMQEEAADRSIANTVFKSAEAVFVRAQKDPVETAELLERVAGVIDVTDLTPERKDQVAAAVAARAVTSGLEDMLGPRIKKHVAAGRQLLASLQTAGAEGDGTQGGEDDNIAASEGVQEIDAHDGIGIAQNDENESNTAEQETVDRAFNEEEIDVIVRRIRLLTSENIIHETAGLDPKGADKFAAEEEIFQFFQRTRAMSVERVKALSLRAGLNPEVMAVFHDIFHVTPDTVDEVSDRVRRIIFPLLATTRFPRARKRMPRQHARPFDEALKLIANAEPEERRNTVDDWMEILIKYFRLAVSMSDEEREEFIEDLDIRIRGTGQKPRK